MNTPYPSRWPDLFDHAMAINDQANALGIGMEDWTFGGGTALMLQIDHRDSHDIDLFVSDAQYLPFLNPETQGFELALLPSSYETDGARALKIAFDGVGEIDFICCPPVTAQPTKRVLLRGRDVNLKTPAEIIGKKIMFRGARLQPRDMFDIAAASIALGEDELAAALSDFGTSSQVALNVARNMNPDLARTVMSWLMTKPGYYDLPETAQDITCRVLSRLVEQNS